MRWVNSQLGRILGWVERAIQQEVNARVHLILSPNYAFWCFHLSGSGMNMMLLSSSIFFLSKIVLYIFYAYSFYCYPILLVFSLFLVGVGCGLVLNVGEI